MEFNLDTYKVQVTDTQDAILVFIYDRSGKYLLAKHSFPKVELHHED